MRWCALFAAISSSLPISAHSAGDIGSTVCHKPAPVFAWGAAAKQWDATLKQGLQTSADIARLASQSATDAKTTIVMLLQDSGYSTASLAASAAKSGLTHISSADCAVQYTYPGPQSLETLLTEIRSSNTHDKQVDVTFGEYSLQDLLRSLADSGASVASGDHSLVTVKLDTMQHNELDAIIGETLTALKAVLGDDFLMLVSSNAAAPGCGQRRRTAASSPTHQHVEVKSRQIRITPDILSGLLYLLLFLAILAVGLGCLGDISYPKTFILPEGAPAQGREY